MLRVVKSLLVFGYFASLTACASVFSPYDSEFSCKNSDHGGCKHPLEAYAEAKSEAAPSYQVAPVEVIEEHLDHEDHKHAHALTRTDFQSYQDAGYRELEGLLTEPDTPILTPAKTIRTLILPYRKTEGGQQLFMPRYVFTVIDNPRFVLGNYLTRKDAGLSLEALLGNAAKSEE